MEFKLKDIAEFNTTNLSKKNMPTTINYLDTSNITNGVINEIVSLNTKYDKVPSRARRRVAENDIIYSTVRPNQKHFGFITKDLAHITVSTGFTVIKANKQFVNPYYLYSYLTTDRVTNLLQGIAENSTTAYPSINPSDIGALSIELPSLNVQEYIVNLIFNIDLKLKTNLKIISNLEQLSQTLFKQWFIDFEFPNEEGKPYKSSGGEMVESELGEIPSLFNTGTLADIYQNFDSKRKPLSKMERLKREKVYPYYGAASLMDFVDDYLFDGIYLLLGEDGTVQTKEGYPVLQLVDGKFWVNNHAHVMQGANGFLTEYLYIMLKNINIKNIITGAVQPKISQRNLNNIKIIIPDEKSIEEFQKNIKLIIEEILHLRKENKNLTQLRDALLPKLLSGEIEIPDDVEV